MPSTDRGGAATAATPAPPAPKAEATMMKAVAVFPGTPNSMHLAQLAKPAVCRGARRAGRAGEGAPRRRGRHRQGDQRGRVRRRAPGLRLPGDRPRELRPGRGRRAQRDRARARRLRRGDGPAAGPQHLRSHRHVRHDHRRRVLRARHQPAPRLPHRVLRGRSRVHREDSAWASRTSACCWSRRRWSRRASRRPTRSSAA